MNHSKSETNVLELFLALFLLFLLIPQGFADESHFDSAEGVVKELYDLVTFDAGSTPDWDRVRALFIDEGIVVLRTSRDSSTVFTVEGFVDDFVNFTHMNIMHIFWGLFNRSIRKYNNIILKTFAVNDYFSKLIMIDGVSG